MKWRLLLKLVVSAGLLGWLLSHTPLTVVLAELGHVAPGIVLAGALLSLCCWIVAALRLWTIAPEFPLVEVMRMSFVAQFYGTVLPGQLAGDVVKIWRLARYQRFPGHAAAATLVDRGTATLALFALGTAAGFATVGVPRALQATLCLVTFGITAGGWLLSRRVIAVRLQRWSEGFARHAWLAGTAALLQRIAQALHEALRRPRRVLVCLLLALLFHGLCIGNHVLIGYALGIGIGVPAWTLVYAGVSLLLLLPISLAGLGLREGGYAGLLLLFGIARDAAIAVSLIFLAYALFGALLGLLVELADGRRARNGAVPGPPA